jgi:hypothetical protein
MFCSPIKQSRDSRNDLTKEYQVGILDEDEDYSRCLVLGEVNKNYRKLGILAYL